MYYLRTSGATVLAARERCLAARSALAAAETIPSVARWAPSGSAAGCASGSGLPGRALPTAEPQRRTPPHRRDAVGQQAATPRWQPGGLGAPASRSLALRPHLAMGLPQQRQESAVVAPSLGAGRLSDNGSIGPARAVVRTLPPGRIVPGAWRSGPRRSRPSAARVRAGAASPRAAGRGPGARARRRPSRRPGATRRGRRGGRRARCAPGRCRRRRCQSGRRRC